MKKTATLVAGLLLVTGTVLAGGLFADGWSLSGSVAEGTLWLMDSENGPLTNDGGDLDLSLKASKEGDLGKFTVEVNMQKFEGAGENDHEVVATYSRRQGNFEVSLGATLLSNGENDGDEAKFRLQTKDNDGTFLRWYVTDTLTATYYPWEVADMKWDEEFEVFDFDVEGGLALGLKVNENTTATFKYAIIEGNSDDTNGFNEYGNSNENKFAFKAELETKIANGSLKAFFGFAQEAENGEDLMALGALLKMDLSDLLALEVEAVYEDSDAHDDAAIGLYAKATMKLNDIAEYKASTYGQVTYANDGMAGGDDLIELEAGLTLAQGNFSVTPKVVIAMQDGAFAKYDDKPNGEDTAFRFGVNFKYEL